MNGALALRQKVLTCNELKFSANITADFGDEIFQFAMDCISEKTGDVLFSVTSPDSITGISGKISADTGKLTFEDKILAFPLVVEGFISPISCPWIFLNCLKNGYLSSCGKTNDGTQIIIDDSFCGENIQCILWLNKNDVPCYSEIVWKGRRVLSFEIKNIVMS